MPAKCDLTKFHRSVNFMRQVPGKQGPDVVNRSVAKICIGSGGSDGIVQLTKRASREQIREDMLRMVTTTGARGGSHSVPLVILLAAKGAARQGAGPTKTGVGKKFGKSHGDKLWRAVVRARAKRIIAARIRSRGFIVAGWLHALDNLRTKAPKAISERANSGVEKFLGGRAALSFSKAATGSSLSAGLSNVAEGADKISTNTLIQTAIDGATEDNLVYLRRKFGDGIDEAINGRPL